jgi:flagellin
LLVHIDDTFSLLLLGEFTMAMTINTNIGAENAVRLMDKTSRSQATSMERLTSGQRINSAKDDSSGLSVATNMNVQSRGLGIAMNNANDSVNMIQTADGALNDTTELLQRMREIGLQAMNSTYTSNQRIDMNAEFQQLNSEISRMASNTKFNNMQLLKGTGEAGGGTGFSFQIGWETGVQNRMIMSGFKLASIQGSVKSMGGASMAVQAISVRLQSIQTQRAKWGAVVNRLDNAVSNMNNMQTRTDAAKSRVLDTDYAKESANLARTQVLQQAGQAMLSQANQSSQNVMSLLR